MTWLENFTLRGNVDITYSAMSNHIVCFIYIREPMLLNRICPQGIQFFPWDNTFYGTAGIDVLFYVVGQWNFFPSLLDTLNWVQLIIYGSFVQWHEIIVFSINRTKAGNFRKIKMTVISMIVGENLYHICLRKNVFLWYTMHL